MKKSIVAICCMAFMLAFSSTILASTDKNNGTGGTLTITVDNVDGATTNFTFEPSPHVGISTKTTDATYAITTANSVTGKDNGMEYGTTYSAAGYALKEKTTDAGNGPTAPSSDTSIGTGWNWQGGS